MHGAEYHGAGEDQKGADEDESFAAFAFALDTPLNALAPPLEFHCYVHSLILKI